MNLIQLKESTEEKNRIEKLLNRTKKELTQEQNKLIQLNKKQQKEFEDVKRLEEGGIAGLFHEILGTNEKKLDKNGRNTWLPNLNMRIAKNRSTS